LTSVGVVSFSSITSAQIEGAPLNLTGNIKNVEGQIQNKMIIFFDKGLVGVGGTWPFVDVMA
jgi:hypothetical protein